MLFEYIFRENKTFPVNRLLKCQALFSLKTKEKKKKKKKKKKTISAFYL